MGGGQKKLREGNYYNRKPAVAAFIRMPRGKQQALIQNH